MGLAVNAERVVQEWGEYSASIGQKRQQCDNFLFENSETLLTILAKLGCKQPSVEIDLADFGTWGGPMSALGH